MSPTSRASPTQADAYDTATASTGTTGTTSTAVRR
ncbi:MAG: hypothetical protein AVDCRST_MAG41-2050 [uncultured Corynebacteriales bacterium]|uniref:Uncharacterized protein n=1 Tax=uncultured Mycobacteriales bacterium TaxID=581187 RepID=A0A6J4IL40_9ACTN|nr:MAG: hypothetical protein AVDCRST_MAG41-2050 [uncultured Corynebacteriales bacterium]